MSTRITRQTLASGLVTHPLTNLKRKKTKNEAKPQSNGSVDITVKESANKRRKREEAPKKIAGTTRKVVEDSGVSRRLTRKQLKEQTQNNNNIVSTNLHTKRTPVYRSKLKSTDQDSTNTKAKPNDSIYDFDINEGGDTSSGYSTISEETKPLTESASPTSSNNDKTLTNPSDDELVQEEKLLLEHRTCKICSTLFDTPLELLRHTRDCHTYPTKVLSMKDIEKYFDSPNKTVCPICERPIKTKNFRSVFIKHLLIHTTKLDFECKVCNRKFRRLDHMRAHERRHIETDGNDVSDETCK